MGVSFIYPKYLWFLLFIPLMLNLSLYGTRRLDKNRFRTSLAFRSIVSLAIILAVSGLQFHLQTDLLTTIFLLDFSDSIPPEQQQFGENIINQAVQDMPKGDKAAIIVFGKDALVERLASDLNKNSRIESIPISSQTNIADSMQLALALFPNEGAKRVILLSDGQENLGYAIEQAELFAASKIELLYFPLNNRSQDIEVYIEKLDAPATIRKGEQFQLSATIYASDGVQAQLTIWGNNEQMIESREINLLQGQNKYVFPISEEDSGFYRYRASINPDSDSRLQNNEASAFVFISGAPKILVIEGLPGEGKNIADALSSADMIVTISPPSGLPTNIIEASSYEAIILVNTPSSQVPSGSMEIIQSYVRDLGKGFVMVGGENAFGSGGYLRTPIEEILPVNMDVRSKELTANLALVLAIDKSGSMGRCHCDNPDLNQQYTRQEVGQPKVDIAKEAVMKAASALGSEDYLGVVAFDSTSKWAIEINKLSSNSAIERAIGGIFASGQTNIRSGVESAYESLLNIDAKKKHIILLTDGWSQSGDLTSFVQEMADNGITLSIIAAGGGSADYLEGLSLAGNGRYYPAEDILRVPEIFLKETVQSVGEYIIEETFLPIPDSPGPSLVGIDLLTLPAIYGYNGTTPKTAARLDLISPKGDPVLATWQYGLGRSAAWTSDLKGKWAQNWVVWDNFSKFASQLIGWVLPEPKSDFIETLATLNNSEAMIRLIARNEFGQPLNGVTAWATIITPNLESFELPLEQIGTGQYQATFEANESGSYLIRIGANDQELHSLGQQTVGLAVPYSPEYKIEGIHLAKLHELAQLTGGGELTNSQNAFQHNLSSSSYAIEIWRPLLILSVILFPFDVAVRRLNITKTDLLSGRSWLINRFHRKDHGSTDEPKELRNLFEARNRVRHRSIQISDDEDLLSYNQDTNKPDSAIEDQIENDSTQDTLSRLREVKKQSRKKED